LDSNLFRPLRSAVGCRQFVVVGLLFLVALARAAADESPAETKPPPASAETTRAKLAGSASDHFDSSWTFETALQFLADRYDLQFSLDEKAFEDAGVTKVRGVVVRVKGKSTVKGATLHQVLCMVLQQVPGKSEAAFTVRKDGVVVITTAAALAKTGEKPEPPPPPPEKPAPPKRTPEEVRAKLAQPVDSFRPDPPWTLEDALDWVAGRYDVAFEIDEKAFAAGGIENTGEWGIADRERWELKLTTLDRVVRELLARLPEKADAVLTITDGGGVRITTPRALAESVAGKKPEPAPPPDPNEVQRLKDKLDQRGSFSPDPNWAVSDALMWLADRYDLPFNVDQRALKAAGLKKPLSKMPVGRLT